MHLLHLNRYGDPLIGNGPAQVSDLVQRFLPARGIEVSVWTIESTGAPLPARMLRVPKRTARERCWLGAWAPDRQVRTFASTQLEALSPDVVLASAWEGSGEVILEARRRGIPTALLIHDYSLFCFRSWLLDSAGLLCSGPESTGKCATCVGGGLSRRARWRRRLGSVPLLAGILATRLRMPRDSAWSLYRSITQKRAFAEAVLRSVDRLIAQSPRSVDLLLRFGIGADRVRLLPQCVHPEKVNPEPRKTPPGGTSGPLTIGFVGRASAAKGFGCLLEAFRSLEDPAAAELLVITNSAGIPFDITGPEDGRKIIVRRGLKGREVGEALRAVDVLVVPSCSEETGSRVLLEALAEGVPVVATDTVGNGYLLEKHDCGLVVPAGDVQALLAGLRQVVRTPGKLQYWRERIPKLPTADDWADGLVSILSELPSTPARFSLAPQA